MDEDQTENAFSRISKASEKIVGGTSLGGGAKVSGLGDVVIKGGLKRGSSFDDILGTKKAKKADVPKDVSARLDRVEADVERIKRNLREVGKI